MLTFIVVVLATLQGLSEFLPISSSAHLLLTPWFFNWQNPGLAYDAAIHLGTALALVIYFWRDFWKLIKDRDKLLWYILLASIPGALIGFLGDKWIEQNLHNSYMAPLIVGSGLIMFSFVIWYADEFSKKQKSIKQISLGQSLIIGFAQALALIPGVSRSGITITAGLFTGLKREAAARFSFLLATPITVGAGLYKAFDIISDPQRSVNGFQLVLGVMVAAVVGLAVIKWLLNYLNKHDLKLFIYYRIALGVIVILVWYLKLYN